MTDMINLFGWDTAFGISFTNANKAITKGKSTPAAFSSGEKGKVNSMSGTWGTWQLTSGGSGQNVWLSCPVTSGTATLPASSGSGTTQISLASAIVTIQVKLQFVPDPAAPIDPAGGTAHQLKVNTQGVDGDKAVTVMDGSYGSGVSTIDAALQNELFEIWFNANIGQFNHVFAVLMLYGQVDTAGLHWLKPTAAGYAVADAPDKNLDKSVFAVVAMTSGDPAGVNAHTVDPGLLQNLPQGANSAFALSPRLVLANILAPGAANVISGATAADFEIADDGLSLINPKSLTWGKFDFQGHTVAPTIPVGGFSLSLVGKYVHLCITGASFHAPQWKGPGEITATLSTNQMFEFGTTSEEGKVYFAPGESQGAQHFQFSLDADADVIVFEIGMAIVTSVALALLGKGLSSYLASRLAAQVATQASSSLVVLDNSIADGTEMTLLNTDGATAASTAMAQGTGAAAVQPAGSMMAANLWKILAGIIAMTAGGVVGSMSAIIDAVAKHQVKSIPGFESFAQECLKHTTWPDLSGWTLKGASLSGPLVVAGDLTTAD